MKRFKKYLLQCIALVMLASVLTGCVVVPVPIEPWHGGHYHDHRW